MAAPSGRRAVGLLHQALRSLRCTGIAQQPAARQL